MIGRAGLVWLLVYLLVWWVVACGSSPPPPSGGSPAHAAAPELPALPRSSIAAVLLHRDELKLADDQVRGLQEIDEKLAERRDAMVEPAPAPKPDGGKAPPPDRLHMVSGRGGGPPRPHPQGAAPSRGSRNLQERLDDEDTRAYLRAEKEVLAPDQRDRARAIAERYREELYDRRVREAQE